MERVKRYKRIKRRNCSLKKSIEAVISFNQGLNGEIEKLEKDVKKLEAFKSSFCLADANQRLTSQLIEISRMSVNSIVISKQVDIDTESAPNDSNESDNVFLPKVVLRNFNDKTSCKGCGKQFARQGTTAHPDYYVHCIKHCAKYQKLGLISKCVTCNKLFVNVKSRSLHRCQTIQKPKWMSETMYSRCFTSAAASCNSKECPGCGKVFLNSSKTEKNGVSTVQRLSLEYVIHVIEDCDKYKDLNLIRECKICNIKFISPQSYQVHFGMLHKSNV